MPQLGKPSRIDARWSAIPVLSVSRTPSDHTALSRLLPGPQWHVYRAGTAVSAMTSLDRLRPVPIVVCERDLLPDTWQELLLQIVFLPDPPVFIVASRFADDYLWAEALNLGAYDVLAKPFNITELTRSLSLAWLRSQRPRDINNPVPTRISATVA